MNNQEWPEGVRVAYTYNGVSLSLSIIDNDESEFYTISIENPNFQTAFTALKNKDIEGLISAVKPIRAVERVVLKTGFVELVGDSVVYNGEVMHGVLVERILEFNRQGLDFTPLALFMDNLMQNLSKTARDELFLFLESSNTPMPITEDGYFLAYKKVNHNFYDLYSGTVDYSVGSIPEMDRKDVDDDRRVTCSDGLHFCALSYLSSYHDGDYPVVIVKINPADVVSIPYDYNNAKGRACRMEVIGIHTKTQTEPAWDNIYSTTDSNRTVDVTDVVDTTKLDDTIYDESRLEYFNTRKEARWAAIKATWDTSPKVVDLWKVSSYLYENQHGRLYYQGPSTCRWAVYYY